MGTNTSFSQRLACLMAENGDTQKKLAEELHTSQQSVSNWKNGKCIPDKELIVAIANRYNVTIDYLLGAETSCESKLQSYKVYFYNSVVINEIIDSCLDAIRSERQYEIKICVDGLLMFSMLFPPACNGYKDNNCEIHIYYPSKAEDYVFKGNFYDFLKEFTKIQKSLEADYLGLQTDKLTV